MTAMQQAIGLARRQVRAGLLGSFSFALVISVAEYFTPASVPGWMSVLGILIAGMIGLAVGDKVMKHPERVPCPKSPRELIALTEGKTQIEAEGATELYIGTWLRVQGRVYHVSEESNQMSVGLELKKASVDLELKKETVCQILIFSDFDKLWRDRVKIIPLEATVTVVGEIADISLFMTGPGLISGRIALKKCELADG